MRLLNVDTLELEYYASSNERPPYAILSHTLEEEEVLFEDWFPTPYDAAIEVVQMLRGSPYNQGYADLDDLNKTLHKRKPRAGHEKPYIRRARQKVGWNKVSACCREAKKFGLTHVWIDTLCIDKRSSAELSEAINSMWAWYKESTVCFAYLQGAFFSPDLVNWTHGLYETPKWFTRGWTLQELLAPSDVHFFNHHWEFIGNRSSLSHFLGTCSGIDPDLFTVEWDVESRCVSERLSWATKRVTTRPEDSAYCLMGLFGVTLPILYGEGGFRALFRLQVEIFKATNDYTLFAWDLEKHIEGLHNPYVRNDLSLLAPNLSFVVFRTDLEVGTGLRLPDRLHRLWGNAPLVKDSDYAPNDSAMRVQFLSRSSESRRYRAYLPCMLTRSPGHDDTDNSVTCISLTLYITPYGIRRDGDLRLESLAVELELDPDHGNTGMNGNDVARLSARPEATQLTFNWDDKPLSLRDFFIFADPAHMPAPYNPTRYIIPYYTRILLDFHLHDKVSWLQSGYQLICHKIFNGYPFAFIAQYHRPSNYATEPCALNSESPIDPHDLCIEHTVEFIVALTFWSDRHKAGFWIKVILEMLPDLDNSDPDTRSSRIRIILGELPTRYLGPHVFDASAITNRLISDEFVRMRGLPKRYGATFASNRMAALTLPTLNGRTHVRVASNDRIKKENYHVLGIKIILEDVPKAAAPELE